MKKPKNIDEYIEQFPKNVQGILEKIRKIVQKTAPDASEAISYGLPTYKLNGNLVHFGAWKNHIGFYPTPSGTKMFKKELSKYEGAKGSVKFLLNKPIPLDLIKKIVKFRVEESKNK